MPFLSNHGHMPTRELWRVSSALRTPQRTPLLLVAKSAFATVLAWFVAGWLIPGPAPVFAAIAALLVVQPSVNQSIGKALERSVGVIVGVVVASALGILLGDAGWVVSIAIVAALVLAWALRMTPGTGNQVAVSAMLVLALGTGTPGYAVDRVLETLIGAAIGFLINLAIVPPLSLVPAHRGIDTLGEAIAATLERLALAIPQPQSSADLDSLLSRARELKGVRDDAEQALAAARESLTLNPRAPRHREELTRLESLVAVLTPIVTQAIGMTRAFRERYDDTLRDEPAMAAIAEQLRRAAHDVRVSVARGVATSEGVPEDETAALTRPLSIETPSSDHWVLVGSLLVDLLRIHHGLTQPDA